MTVGHLGTRSGARNFGRFAAGRNRCFRQRCFLRRIDGRRSGWVGTVDSNPDIRRSEVGSTRGWGHCCWTDCRTVRVEGELFYDVSCCVALVSSLGSADGRVHLIKSCEVMCLFYAPGTSPPISHIMLLLVVASTSKQASFALDDGRTDDDDAIPRSQPALSLSSARCPKITSKHTSSKACCGCGFLLFFASSCYSYTTVVEPFRTHYARPQISSQTFQTQTRGTRKDGRGRGRDSDLFIPVILIIRALH